VQRCQHLNSLLDFSGNSRGRLDCEQHIIGEEKFNSDIAFVMLRKSDFIVCVACCENLR